MKCQDTPLHPSESDHANGNSPSCSIEDEDDVDAVKEDDVHEAFITCAIEVDTLVHSLIKLTLSLCRHRFLDRHARYIATKKIFEISLD